MSLGPTILAVLLASTNADGSVDAVLDREPGSLAAPSLTLHQRGSTEVGGVAGTFELDASLDNGPSQLTLRSGPMVEANGWDRAPWAARDGAVTTIGLPAAVRDAAAERFLRRYGWRDHSSRRFMNLLPTRLLDRRVQAGVRVTMPGMAPISLWFDQATGRLSEAVTEADMGPLKTTFEDWRKTGQVGYYAFRRTQRDATGQSTTLIADTMTISATPASGRPIPVNHGRQSSPATVPFTLTHGDRGHIVVNARINKRPAKLVFDTGAANYLTPPEAQRFGLTVEGGVDVGGVGDTSLAGGYTRIVALEVGSVRLVGTVAIVAPLPEAATQPRPGLTLQGLTGAELLAAFKTTIDYGARALTLAPFDDVLPRNGQTIALVSDGQGLFVQASVEGTLGWFRLDTGDAGTVTLFPGFAKTHGLAGGDVKVNANQVGGALRTSTRRFASFQLADRQFVNVNGEVSGQSAGAFSSQATAGNIGAGLLSCFAITLNTRHGKATFVSLPVKLMPSSCIVRSPKG